MSLHHLAQSSPVIFPALCDTLEAVGDLLVAHVSIAQRVPDVGMVEHALHDLEVADLPQRLGREVVAEVMEAEGSDASSLAQPVPVRPQPGQRDRIAPAPSPIRDASAPPHR